MNVEKKIRELEYRILSTQEELNHIRRQLQLVKEQSKAQEPKIYYEQPQQPVQEQNEQKYEHDHEHDQFEKQQEKAAVQKDMIDHTADMDWEHILAKVWLPRVFIFVLILGVLWGFSAAITHNIITEPVRVIIGIVASVVLAYIGVRQMNNQREVLGHVLLGGSIAIATLSVFAAHMLYELIPITAVAFVLYALTFVLALYAGIRYKSQTILILSAVGTFLIPFLVGLGDLNPWILAIYQALFLVGLLYLSIRHNYSASYVVTFISLHLSFFIVTQSSNVTELPFMLGVLLQHVVLLVVFYTHKKLDTSKIATLYVSFCFTLGWVHLFYDDAVKWILLAASILYSILTMTARQQKNPINAVLMSIATFSWFMYIVSIAKVEYLSLIFVVQGTLSYWVGQRYRSIFQQVTALIVFLFGAVLTIAVPIEKWISYETVAWFGLVVSLYVGYLMTKKVFDEAWMFLVFDSIIALAFITQLTYISTQSLSYDLQHLFVSFAWILYAIVIVSVGLWKDKKGVRLAGILFLFFTLLKVIFFDLPSISITIRAILFIALGLIGLLVSRIFYKKNE